ncbi:polymer-forming cytoskeletal protein [Hydrogenophaga sp. D2P1]|jgi:cytoskeletal protein CcmA (bactofilin family)|uniref:Polymer-forming cytoskeletal protein n=2 Tax=Hydrogenophaga aromaticivorans TaxID=2610898 RepID=A0A7Y8GWH9_9BURK|nr:polymer-forming cytoskeletal protein [Hydrogenophaga aromaticivorans]
MPNSKTPGTTEMIKSDITSRYQSGHCLVPLGSTMNGEVLTEEPIVLILDGVFDGTISMLSGGTVIISATATVTAKSIEADDILIEGAVSGEVHARKSLVLADSSKFRGQAQYGQTVSVEPKARINGALVDTSWSN